MYRMYHHRQSEHDKWWFGEKKGAPPGNVVPIVGAGISVDSPTCLPAGVPLTNALIRHLLDEQASEEMLSKFERHQEVLGRPVARLEHLLSVAAKAAPNSLQLLNIFNDVKPNRNHEAVAENLLRSKGWAITTNFDEAIEKAGDYGIPVHTYDPKSDSVEVTYCEQDADWGLVKLHGSIGQGIDGLGATLEAITPGLPGPLRELFDRVLSGADFVVIAGYSASDHFDVNMFLREKLNANYQAHLIWINHRKNTEDVFEENKNKGVEVFNTAFNGHHTFDGDTHVVLSRLFGTKEQSIQVDTENWMTKIDGLYRPTDRERHQITAYISSAMGFSTIAQEAIARLRREANNEDEALLLEAMSYASEGRWRIAKSVLEHPKLHKDIDAKRFAASIDRHAGHPIRSLVRHAFRKEKNPNGIVLKRAEMACCLLDVYRSLMWVPFAWARPSNLVWGWLVERQLAAARKQAEAVTDPMCEARYQLANIRRQGYCEDYLKFGSPYELRNLIEDEVSYPELYIKGKPAFPGYYLTPAPTAIELDDLQALLEVRLAYADALAVCARRSYLGVLRGLSIAAIQLIHGKDRAAYKRRNEIQWPMEVMIASIKEQLRKARDIAEMLDCDYAQKRVAKAWMKADRMVWGFNSWKRQRQYLD